MGKTVRCPRDECGFYDPEYSEELRRLEESEDSVVWVNVENPELETSMTEVVWPEGTIGIPNGEDIDLRERSWEEVMPFQTPSRLATVLEVTDADTVKMRVDVGFDLDGPKVKVRLIAWKCGIEDDRLGVDAFETTLRKGQTEEMKQRGIAAKERALELMPVGSQVLVHSRLADRGSMDRFLAMILVPLSRDVPLEEVQWVSLGDLLMAEGYATVWWRDKTQGRERPQ